MASANTPFTVSADHAGLNTDGYKLKVDGAVQQTKPVSALSAGVISFADSDGMPKGQYTVVVSAYNIDGEVDSAPMALVISGNPPAAPVNVRITVI